MAKPYTTLPAPIRRGEFIIVPVLLAIFTLKYIKSVAKDTDFINELLTKRSQSQAGTDERFIKSMTFLDDMVCRQAHRVHNC